MRRGLEVREQVEEEVVRIGRPCVGVPGLGLGFRGQGVAVGEDYDFVDAEDGEGAGDVPRHGGAEVVGLCTGIVLVGDDIEGPEGDILGDYASW